jgi:threonine/homoserine/homoserine lactone efflux protein
MFIDLAVNLNLWIAFVFASALLALIPGPIVTLVVANSLAQGTRAGVANVFGTMVGNIVLFTIGGLGLAWILSELAHWFDILRWAGAAYLIYIGIKQWRAKPVSLGDQRATTKGHSLFLQGVVVAITNPKTIIFFAAFFPQFMDPALSASGQLVVLSVTFLIVAGSLDTLYAVLAGRLRSVLTGERRGRIRNKLTGALLMGTGVALAFARR